MKLFFFIFAATFVLLGCTSQTRPDFSTPQKTATAYYRALINEDGQLLIACTDTRDDAIKTIVTAWGATLDAYRHYGNAAKKKFGNVDDYSLPSNKNREFLAKLMSLMPQAKVTIKVDHAELVPVLPPDSDLAQHGMAMFAEGGELDMFKMAFIKIDGEWQLRLPDLGGGFQVQTDASVRIQADAQLVVAKAIETFLADFDKQNFQNEHEAFAALNAVRNKAMDDWRAEKARTREATQPATPPATTPPSQ